MTIFILFLLAVNLLGTLMLLWVHGSVAATTWRKNPCDMCGMHQRELIARHDMQVCDLCDQFLRRRSNV